MVDLREAFEQYALSEYPREACALYLERESGAEIRYLKNVAREPNIDFAVDASQLQEVSGNKAEFWHSHTNGNPDFTESDLVACERMGVTWRLFSVIGRGWNETHPRGYIAPLLGRPWSYGFLDCAQLVIDTYAQLGIRINQYSRPPLFGENGRYSWHSPDFNYYAPIFEAEGFERLFLSDSEEPQNYDVILFRWLCRQENHVGVYLDGYVLHHLLDQQSCRDLYADSLESAVSRVYRHPLVTDEVRAHRVQLH